MHLVHIFPPYFPNIHSNIILPSVPRSSEWSHPSNFSDQNFECISHLSHVYYMSCHLILLDLITLIISIEAYKL